MHPLFLLQYHSCNKHRIFYGKLAVASQFFCQIPNALGTVSMSFSLGNGNSVHKFRHFLYGILYGKQHSPIRLPQHKRYNPFFLGKPGNSMQCIGQNGGKQNLGRQKRHSSGCLFSLFLNSKINIIGNLPIFFSPKVDFSRKYDTIKQDNIHMLSHKFIAMEWRINNGE